MSGRDLRERLEAYHDGELSWLGRWRMERRLERDAALRRELEGLQTLGSLLREADAEVPTPDVWEALRLRLPAVDARRDEAAREAGPGLAPRWVGAALAAAAAVLALVVGLNLGAPGGEPGSLRWLDSRGNAVLVLQDDREATIIWLIEAPPENVSRRTNRVLG